MTPSYKFLRSSSVVASHLHWPQDEWLFAEHGPEIFRVVRLFNDLLLRGLGQEWQE